MIDKEDDNSVISDSVILAVYGTLKRGHGNNRLLQSSEFITQGLTTEKYAMYANGIPYVKETVPEDVPTTNITVELFKVEMSDLPRIDQLEGHPNWYQRKQIDVTGDNGDNYKAWIYFYPPSIGNAKLVANGIY